jgi:2-polyprenyl-3-methyl-5-hydroxy-6-metoxy-1,4-benzoquinol methylase
VRSAGRRPVNAYDDSRFFAEYVGVRLDPRGPTESLEQAAVRAALEPLDGRRVLDLGCGMGLTARYAAERGAVHVLGIDLASSMLGYARRANAHPRVSYVQAAMDELALRPGRLDIAVSCLALMMSRDPAGLLARLHDWLRPGGRLVCSFVHPCRQAPRVASVWTRAADGRYLARLDDYFAEGERPYQLVEGVAAVQQHRTLATLVNSVLDAGFVIDALDEPQASDEQATLDLRLELSRHAPMVLVVQAHRPSRPRTGAVFSGPVPPGEPSPAGLREGVELPALLALAPPLAGRRVLDLGCGLGQLALACARAGAEVVALDPLAALVAAASARSAHERVRYVHAPTLDLDLVGGTFDVVVSRRFLASVPDLDRLYAAIARRLAPAGAWVFSVEHPYVLAARDGPGWALDESGRAYWVLRDYGFEGERSSVHYRDRPEPLRHHRRLSTHVAHLTAHGLELVRLVEPQPPVAGGEGWAYERTRPALLIARADRRP